MNVLPCELSGEQVLFSGVPLATASTTGSVVAGSIELGVRPEFVRFDAGGFPVDIAKVDDLGRYRIVEVRREGHSIKMIADEDQDIPSENPRVSFDPARTRVYADGWMVD